MRPLRRLALPIVALAAISAPAGAQSLANYSPVTRTVGVPYTTIAVTGSSLPGWRNGNNTDDNRSVSTPIGFTFYYMGQAFTGFSLSTNGFMDFSSSSASGGGTSAYGGNNTAFTSILAPSPLILAPMYDNLSTQGNPGVGASLNASFKYQTTGSPGSRVLTVEWIGLETASDGSPDLNFQVKLYEGTGAIEFRYGPMTQGTAAFTYSSGLNGLTMSSTPLASELLAQQAPNVATFGNLERNTLSVVPESNTKITFTPLYNTQAAVPTAISFSAVTQTGMTVGWTDNSTNETFFTVARSTDGVSYTAVGTVSSTSTAGTGNTYSLPMSGLTPGTTYFVRITAGNEAGAPSSFLAGSQATPPPGTIASTGSGNWSSTVPDSPWPSGVVPTAADNVTVAAGNTITIDTNAACLSVSVSGSVAFDATTARTLTVGGDVTIAGTGSLASAATGSVTGHVLSVAGSLLNSGVLDLSTNGNLAGASLAFTGSSPASLTGAGPTTDLRALTIAKGSTSAVLDLVPANLTIQGVTGDPAGFVTITSGTLKVSGSYVLNNRLFATAAYTIPNGGGLWLDNPNVTVIAQNANATENGLLRIAQGNFNVGTASGNSLMAGSGAELDILGGTLTVAGRIASATATAYGQSGGIVTVANVSNGSSNNGSFDLSSSVSFFRMSGGTIVLRQASSATTPVDFRVAAESVDITGGVLQLGTSSTTVRFNFRIGGALPALMINNQVNNKTATLFTATPVTRAYATTTVPAGCTLDLNGFTYQQVGATLSNAGTILGGLTGSRLTFAGTVAQSYSGTGTITGPLADLSVDNLAGVTLGSTVPSIVTLRVDLLRGAVTHSDRLTIGGGGLTSATLQIGSPALDVNGGSFDTSPVFNPGAGGLTLLYESEGFARTTGFEIPPTRSVANLTIDNVHGVTLAGGGLTVTSQLALTTGILHTSAANVVTLSGATTPAGSATSHVDGPLAIQVSSVSPVSRVFAVGRDGAFRPVTLQQILTGGTPRTFTAEVHSGGFAGTPLPPLDSLDPTRYWTLAVSSMLNADARIVLGFGGDDGVAVLANARVAQSAAPGGAFATLGGLTTGSPSAGTVASTTDLVPGNDCFTVGIDLPAIGWDGGAGTTHWSDAANWDPDGVPGATDDVSLTPAAPVTIEVDGAFSCHHLVVGNNTSLSFPSGSLSVTGNFTQTGGSASLGPGMLTVSGACSLTGGALDLGSGTLALLGDFTRTAGTFTGGTGTTLASGTGTQHLGGGVTHHHLVLRNGGPGAPKLLTAGQGFSASGDLTVESTAQLGLSAASATLLSVGGSLHYGGAGGGPNIASLTIALSGTGTLGGSALAAARAVSPPVRTRSIPTLEMDLAVADGASYALDGDLALAPGRTLSLAGTLDCGAFTIGGAGSLAMASSGRLGTQVNDPLGLGATVTCTGPNRYANGAIIDYEAAGDQVIHAAAHPDSAMIYTTGAGTKTLDGDKTLRGAASDSLGRAALHVGAGSTFADGGYRLSLAGPGLVNVTLEGAYLASGSGTLSFEAPASGSHVTFADGTALGAVAINFSDPNASVNLETSGSATLTLASLVLGGGSGTGTRGGTLRLSRTGTTDVIVLGDVTRSPLDASSSGGGFDGTGGSTSSVSVRGNLVSTSQAPIEPWMGGTGTNTLVLSGAVPQSLVLARSAAVVDGATLRIDNASGVTLGSAGLVYTVAGTLELANGNLTTGADTVAIAAGDTLLATGGRVDGSLSQHVPAGGPFASVWQIGTAAVPTPVQLEFAGVTGAGTITVTSIAAEHPQIAGAAMRADADVNRYFSLVNGGTAFDRVTATLNFLAGDLDAGAQTDSFVVRRYASGSWSGALIQSRTATSIVAAVLDGLGEFAIGQADTFLVAAEPGAMGSIDPPGVTRVAAGEDRFFSVLPDAGIAVTDLIVDGVAVGPSDSYTFTAVAADHFIAAVFSDTTGPVVQVDSPVGGETFTIGTIHPLLWGAGDNVAVTSVDLLISRAGGSGPYESIATGVANDGSYNWQVTGPATADVFLKVVAHDAAGHTTEDTSDSAFTITSTTGVSDGPRAVLAFSPVAPNPMQGRGTFDFSLPREAFARLTLLDVQGREVATLLEGPLPAGRHALRWGGETHAGRASSGLYFARLETCGRTLVRRFVVTR